MAADETRSGWAGLRFVRAMLAALTDEATYDLRRNPSLWVGFVLGIPIPVLTFMAGGAPEWLKILTLPAPFFWAVILGAAGRLGILAQQERDALEGEVEEAKDVLNREQAAREALEEERDEVVSELKLARAVQATLVPEPIQRPDVEVMAFNLPTRFIGGDYALASVVDDRWLYLGLMDVSGHGISAALVVARLHGLVRRLTLTLRSPVSILERLNRAAQQLLQYTYFFLTAAIMRLDLATGELRYATAGHPAQVLLRKGGELELLRTRNRLLGMDEDIFDQQEPSKRLTLEPGDTLVLFTDGLFEVLEDGAGTVLGEAGLHERLRGLDSVAPPLLIGEVLQELAEFQGRSEFDDDITMIAARYLGRPAGVRAPLEQS